MIPATSIYAPTTVPTESGGGILQKFMGAISDKGGDVLDRYLDQRWGEAKQTYEVTDEGIAEAGAPNSQVNPPPMGYTGNDIKNIFEDYKPIFIGTGMLLVAAFVYKTLR